jgi:hypothetical protein
MMSDEAQDDRGMRLEMWIIYRYPRDYPDNYVARRWVMTSVGGVSRMMPTADHTLGDSLEDVRAAVPAYCVRLERHESDEPQIVESWI